MFADPQSVTVSGTPISLPRVSSGVRSGGFATADLAYELALSNTSGKRNRTVVRLNHSKTAADPLQPATNRPYSMSSYLVIDAPLFGYSVAELKAYVDGLTGWLTASSGANITKILGGES